MDEVHEDHMKRKNCLCLFFDCRQEIHINNLNIMELVLLDTFAETQWHSYGLLASRWCPHSCILYLLIILLDKTLIMSLWRWLSPSPIIILKMQCSTLLAQTTLLVTLPHSLYLSHSLLPPLLVCVCMLYLLLCLLRCAHALCFPLSACVPCAESGIEKEEKKSDSCVTVGFLRWDAGHVGVQGIQCARQGSNHYPLRRGQKGKKGKHLYL